MLLINFNGYYMLEQDSICEDIIYDTFLRRILLLHHSSPFTGAFRVKVENLEVVCVDDLAEEGSIWCQIVYFTISHFNFCIYVPDEDRIFVKQAAALYFSADFIEKV